jgi:nucleoside-diphosphate-sugar epimerase
MGNPLTVWSTAYEQQRPYLDLVDAGRAFTFIIRNDLFDGQIYNVLSQNSSVRQIIEVIRDYVPEIEIEFVESMIMNQLSYKVSCEKFESKGFKFVGELHRGISETINLLRQSNSLAH